MPLHAPGALSESLDTHPATLRRLQDAAGCSGIPPERLQQLLSLNDAKDATGEHYALATTEAAVGKIFSTAFKSKYIFRISWAILATVVATPVLLAWLASRLRPQGLFA